MISDGPLDRLDRRRHRHRLAGAGRAEQRLEALARARSPPRASRSPSAGRRWARRWRRAGSCASAFESSGGCGRPVAALPAHDSHTVCMFERSLTHPSTAGGSPMADFTVKRIDDMEGAYGGAFKRARAELGVSSFGMAIIDMPPNFEHYPHARPRERRAGGGLHGAARRRRDRHRRRALPARRRPRRARRGRHGPQGPPRPGRDPPARARREARRRLRAPAELAPRPVAIRSAGRNAGDRRAQTICGACRYSARARAGTVRGTRAARRARAAT